MVTLNFSGSSAHVKSVVMSEIVAANTEMHGECSPEHKSDMSAECDMCYLHCTMLIDACILHSFDGNLAHVRLAENLAHIDKIPLSNTYRPTAPPPKV